MFALADQPFVTTNEYRTVLDTYREHRTPIVSVRYGEVMAPPHLFEREFFPELAQLQHGARSVLQRHAEPDDGPGFRRTCWWISTRPKTTSWPRAVCPGTVKAANRAAEEPAFETASNREDLSENRRGHFLWCLSAERESHRASHTSGPRRVRHVPCAARPASSLS